jgi:hypothetical protein
MTIDSRRSEDVLLSRLTMTLRELPDMTPDAARFKYTFDSECRRSPIRNVFSIVLVQLCSRRSILIHMLIQYQPHSHINMSSRLFVLLPNSRPFPLLQPAHTKSVHAPPKNLLLDSPSPPIRPTLPLMPQRHKQSQSKGKATPDGRYSEGGSVAFGSQVTCNAVLEEGAVVVARGALQSCV